MFVSRNLNQRVAIRQVFAGEAVLLWTEDESDPATARKFLSDACRERRKRNHFLFRFAVREGAGTEHESAVGDGLPQALCAFRALENLWCSNGGPGLAPVGSIGSDDGEPGKAKVGHGACGRTNIEGVAWGDEHHFDAVALGFSGQEVIVVRR